MSEITWADIAYTSPDSARPQLIVRTTRLESTTAEIISQDRDLAYVQTWEAPVWPVISLLNLIRM